MKIRTGFVSNSSSSSFCIMAYMINFDTIQDKINETILSDFTNFKNINWESIYYGIEEYYDDVFIGKSIEELGDDETPNQFKQRISNELKNQGINIEPHELSLYIDGGRDH